MHRRDRILLTQGPLIDIIDHNGNNVTSIPYALFQAASNRLDLIFNDIITIPDIYNLDQVKRLVFLMLKVPTASYVGDLAPTENTFVDIHFHSAAEYLGMGDFTQTIFDLYFKRVNNTVPSVANIESIGAVRTPPGDKIYKQMAYNIGVRYFEDKIANRADFEAYLCRNPRLDQAVAEVVTRKQAIREREEFKFLSHQGFLEREAKRADWAEREKAWEQRTYAEAKEKNAVRTSREEKAKKDAEVRASMLEKRQRGIKLNPEEARAYEKQFGRHIAC
ncbi:hypothetical protein FB567DRAFT_562180 [Paraphoma chrysanthemicola]|uniref:Uncharacterized protein n=1 Tax=Paraphoma chrysanthemicola TaxID=798071 RepID=A0A8K0R3R6_9PLEO|nr:hypothetical protein FB567DRAFT_562180 [Paraphoma chrysanthemicola]